MSRVKIFILVVVMFATLFTIYLAFQMAPKSEVRISFLDVGQGDATLIQTPGGGTILVDGGRDKKVLSEMGRILPAFKNKIDIVVATHDDSDHITGLIDVLKKYQVGVLLYSLPNSSSELSKELVRIAREKDVRIVHIKKPMFIRSDDGVVVKILFPVRDMDNNGVAIENREVLGNDASVVSQIIFGNIKILLTGDLSITGENYLIEKYGEGLRSDILKLGHHGSETSTGASFLQVVKPAVAIASVGENNTFGHPHRSVVELVEKFGIKLYRTDTDQAITFSSNGLNFWKK